MTVGPEEGTRLRERALRAAATAYSAAHGHPLEHPTSGGVRWRSGTLAVVAGAVVLACLVGVVGIRAAVRPAPEPTLAGNLAPATTEDGGPTDDVTGTAGASDPAGTHAGDDALGEDGADDGAHGDDASVVVHVVGAVAAPGLVRLPPGARVADAVELAGGATAEADLAGLNLARQVHDGEQIRVPVPGEEVPPAAEQHAGNGSSSGGQGAQGGALPEGSPAGRVDVNRATAAELEALPGIGPVLAERVVAHRTDHGPFPTIDALTAVSGIGPRVLAGLRDHVVAEP